MCLWYSYSWGQGIWNYWIIKDKNEKNKEKEEEK